MTSRKECDKEACKGKIILTGKKINYFSLADCVGVNGEPCIFPFNYHGKSFDKCTHYDASYDGQIWCAVAVNSGGDMTSWKDCDTKACKG